MLPTLAVVLAAGKGERMGGPKALVPWTTGTPLVIAHAHAALQHGASRVLLVVRQSTTDSIEAHALPRGAEWCVSVEDDALGPAGSLRAAVGVADTSPWVAVCPVDVAPEAWAALPALCATLARDPALLAAKPQVGLRRGHPVLLRREVLAPYRAATPTLREVLGALGPRACPVPLELPAVLTNLDDPQALKAWREQTQRANTR